MSTYSLFVIFSLISFIRLSHFLTLYPQLHSTFERGTHRIFPISHRVDLTQDISLIVKSNSNNSIEDSWKGLLYNETVRFNLSVETLVNSTNATLLLPTRILEGCRYYLRISSESESEIFIIWIIFQDPIFQRVSHYFNHSISVNLTRPAHQYSLIPEVLFNIDNNKLNVFIPPVFSNAFQIDICELVEDALCGSIHDILQPDLTSMMVWTDRVIYFIKRGNISVISSDFDTSFIRSDTSIVTMFNRSSVITFHNITSDSRFYFNLTLPDNSFHIVGAEILKQDLLLVLISSATESRMLALSILSNNVSRMIYDIWTFQSDRITQFYVNPFSHATFATSRDVVYSSDNLALGFTTLNISNITEVHFQTDSCIMYRTETSFYFSNSFVLTDTDYLILDSDVLLDTWGQPFTVRNNSFSLIAINQPNCIVSKMEFIPNYLPSLLTLDKWETTIVKIMFSRLSHMHNNFVIERYREGPALLKHSHYSIVNQTHREVTVEYKPTGLSHVKIIPRCLGNLHTHQQSLEIRVTCPQQHSLTLLPSSHSEKYDSLPPNYRPPSSHGTSVYTSPHVYNYHPELPMPPSLHKESISPVIKLCTHSMARKDCNCTEKMIQSEELRFSECKKLVRTHHYHHSLHIAPAITWEGGEVLRVLSSPFTLTEVNNRTDYLYSNTSNNHIITFNGGGLFHFESELISDIEWTYCSFRTQFQVFVIHVPLHKEVEHAVTVITATIFGLGMGIACVLLRDGKKLKISKLRKKSYFK